MFESQIPHERTFREANFTDLALGHDDHRSYFIDTSVLVALTILVFSISDRLWIGGSYSVAAEKAHSDRIIGKVDSGTDLRPSRSTLQDCIYFAQHRASRHARCVAMQVWLLVPQKR
jgi:hypothetical protein